MAEGEENARTRTLAEYAVVSPDACATSIVRPAVTANNFEIKPAYISLVQQDQFSGAPIEDPAAHVANFLSILDFFKIQGASDEAIRLRLFPFSLRDRAKSWLLSQPQGSFTDWEGLVRKFIDKYFPPAKQARLRQDIHSFAQQEGESLHEAWERFKQLLKKCPTHALPDWMQIRLFYDGLKPAVKGNIDAAAGGSLDAKTPAEAMELIDKMAQNSSHSVSERGVIKKTDLDLSQVQALFTQNKEMQQQIAALTKQLSQAQLNASSVATATPELGCDFCGGNHRNGECSVENSQGSEQANFIGGGQRRPYQNNFNQGYRSHPNFSWNSPALQPPQSLQPPPQSFQQNQPSPPAKSALELMVEKMSVTTNAFMEETRTAIRNQGATIRNLETQLGQLARQMGERQQGTFPGDTIANPKEQCKAVTLRSGTAYAEPKQKDEVVVSDKAEEKPPEQQSQEPMKKTSPVVLQKGEYSPVYDKVPFPQRLKKQEDQRQFAKFMDVFKRLQINIPFAEALEQMPTYAKFMKELLTNKRKMVDDETVMLTEECSAILQKKLPQKLKDPGSFTIPCNIGGMEIGKALCDLGASINLMPLSMYQRLGIGEVKPTKMCLQLADRTMKRPYGRVEDVLVKVDKFIFPADFVVLDMEEDYDIPLLLGRPFLATGRALIDVQQGELKLRVHDEEVSFNVYNSMKFPLEVSSCFRVDMIPEQIGVGKLGVATLDPGEKKHDSSPQISHCGKVDLKVPNIGAGKYLVGTEGISFPKELPGS